MLKSRATEVVIVALVLLTTTALEVTTMVSINVPSDFLITIFPVPFAIFSLKVNVNVGVKETLVASSAGIVDDKVGGVTSLGFSIEEAVFCGFRPDCCTKSKELLLLS